MAWNRWFRNYFGFTKAQANGSIILLFAVTLWVFSQPVYRWWLSRNPRDFTHEKRVLDSLSANWKKEEQNILPPDEEIPVSRFSFNPNQVSLEELQALGFSEGLSRRLINYRNKGGKFFIKKDLLKLYGMDSSFYESLVSWIELPDVLEKKYSSIERSEQQIQADIAPVKFDLNQADTTLLKSVYGIGSSRSKRIVKFRESLGGYISTDQLYSVYGIDSAVVEKIIETSFIQADFQPRRLNINTATEEELSVHPYISGRMARAMVTYRFQHGKYTSVDDLRKILQLNENQLNSIRPYLTVE